jgi:hypothetical protein
MYTYLRSLPIKIIRVNIHKVHKYVLINKAIKAQNYRISLLYHYC